MVNGHETEIDHAVLGEIFAMAPIRAEGRVKKTTEKILAVPPALGYKEGEEVVAEYELTLTLELSRDQYLALARLGLWGGVYS